MDNPDDQKRFGSPSLKRKPSEEDPHCSKRMMPTENECQPISNLSDLYGVVQNPPNWVENVEPLAPRSATALRNAMGDCHTVHEKFIMRSRVDTRTAPKTLVCHDYNGGYRTDRFVKYPQCPVGTGYPFYYWAQIDIFVYYSHHLITIPPLCWINAGHKNGVKVLGTIITQTDLGGYDLCNDKIFESQDTMKRFAMSLAELTSKFGFDGWLLKIDNIVDQIDNLKEFVTYFRSLLHISNPSNLLIWYDSITVRGQHQSQNELNAQNRYFFDACDGIMLSSFWSDVNLKQTMRAARHRNIDVYVGVDVFGKTMLGGGKFHTYKAAEFVRRHNFSMAICAPSWTYETTDSKEDFFEDFLNRNAALWCSIWMYLYTHPICTYFTTNFYIGLDREYYNIFNQQPQLSRCLHPYKKQALPGHETIATLKGSCKCLQAVPLHSKNSCLITREGLNGNWDFIHHLFACDIEIDGATLVYFLTRNVDLKPTTLTVTILTSRMNKCCRAIKLLGYMKDDPLNTESVLEVNQSEEANLYEIIKKRYLEMIQDHKWVLSIYTFDTPLSKIMEVGGIIERGNSLYLGAFGIQDGDAYMRSG